MTQKRSIPKIKSIQIIKGEKGYWWASAYWSANIYQQAANQIGSGYPYGSKGDSRWQQIALSEGWSNYREQVLTRNYLGLPNYSATSNSFLIQYLRMFDELENIGCSYQSMEKSLSTYTILGFRDNLIAIYPSLSTQITTIISSRL